ncbi:hypothetical protein OAG68_01525 [bacterium]|nr:hypothetical protein [bacterium]
MATTVPAPPTNTLNIPQTAQQAPYYVLPTNQNRGLQQTPASAVPNYQTQPQQGWRQVAPNGGAATQNLNPTSFTQQRPNANFQVTGTSQTLNPNYRSTLVDERQDSSRLAVTDASQVRAPARFFPTGNMNRLIQTPVATTAAAVPNPGFTSQTAFGQQVPQQRFAQAPMNINGAVQYQAQVANNQYGVNPYGNSGSRVASYSTNAPVTSSNPTVLAQSTTERTNVASNSQVGWRNAQIGPNNVNR